MEERAIAGLTMDAATLTFRCRCQTLRGTILDSSAGAATRCVCYCSDCQRFLRHLGHEALLDECGGTDLLQTTPRRVRLDAGAEQIRCLQLTEGGVLRWFTACCRTPIANTPASAGAPFAALFLSNLEVSDPARLEASLGPVRHRIYGRMARGTPPAGTHPGASLRHILRTVRLLLQWRLMGHARPSPFFDDRRQPVAPIERVYVEA